MRNKIIRCIIALNLLFLGMAVPAVSADETSAGLHAPAKDTGPLAMALTFFRKTVSRADGRRCMMYPSCSHYSGQAFQKHGFLKGWIMTSDRLLRCGRDEKHLSEQIIINRQTYIFDPVQHNDFWWNLP